MFTKQNQSGSLQYVLQLFLLPITLAILVSACGDDPVTPAEQLEDATGTIQGVVVDKATGDALSDVGVTLVYEDSTDEGSQTFSGSTGNDGSFTLSDVPVSADAKTNGGAKSNPYTLRLDASSLDNYRDNYLAEVDVVFESTEGGDGGIATDMVSNIKIPLSEQAVTVSGKAFTTSDKTISGATVELYQTFNPVVNGNDDNETEMLVATGETGDDGSFSFEGVEEDATIYFKFIDKSDPANAIDHQTGTYTTPSGSENNASLDLGVVKTQPDNEAGAFYITDISPEPGSDVSTDTEFTFTFNRPVADNAWTDASQGFGTGTFKDAIFFNNFGPKKSPGSIEFDVSWNDDRTELTIDPENLIDAHEYRLDTRAAFDNNTNGNNVGSPISSGPIAFEDGNFVDEYDNDLAWNASDYSFSEALQLDFSTGDNQEAPHTPELALEYNTDVNYDGTANGNATISWDVDESDVPVKEYEVYISQNGGPYEYHQTFTENTDHDENEMFATYSAATFTSGNNIEIYNNEEGAVSTDIKIRAISDNLQHGEFSEPVTFEDVVNPEVEYAGNDGDTVVWVNVSEPLDKESAENAEHYTIVDGSDNDQDADITDVQYDFNNINGTYDIMVEVSDSQTLNDGSEIVLKSDITDLNGNEIDEDNNSTTY